MAEEKPEKKQKQPKNPAEGGMKGGGPPGKGDKGGGKKKEGRKSKGEPGQAVEMASDEDLHTPPPPVRLFEAYRDRVTPALMQQFGYKNKLAVPKLEKIVISMGVGRFATAGGEGKASIEKCERELTVIAGQKPVRCKAKKSVANFKVREGMETGLKVTLRGSRMYEFLDRLIALVIPRVKDFRGLNPDSFDKEGNYNFGFTEQTVFPEVDAAAVTFQQGMNVTICTTANKPEEGRELLKQFGIPFRTEAKEGR
jgi:large subunit ribosomal protein L5